MSIRFAMRDHPKSMVLNSILSAVAEHILKYIRWGFPTQFIETTILLMATQQERSLG